VKGDVITVKVGSVEHPMIKEHHIEWIAIETSSGNQRKELDPLGKPEARFALLPGEKVKTVYEYCNLHGLWKLDIK
jgi:superoxide reductase